MRRTWQCLLLFLVLLAPLTLPVVVHAQSVEGSFGPPGGIARPAAEPLWLERVLRAAPLHTLPPAKEGARDQLAAMRAWNAAARRPPQIGFSRRLAELIEVRLDASLIGTGSPTPFAGGFVLAAGPDMLAWGTSVRIAGARRVRLHLTAVRLPSGSKLLVAAPGGEVRAFGLELLAPAGDLWTPSVAGDTVNLEAHVPVAASGAAFDLRETLEVVEAASGPARDSGAATASPKAVPPLLGPMRWEATGRMRSPAELLSILPNDDSCLVDSSCETNANFNNIDSYRHAIAALTFICSGLSPSAGCTAGDQYLCTGSLLNDMANDHEAFMLTAHHCVPDQETASSLESTFDFYTSQCNGAPPDENTEPLVSGSTLLAGQAAGVTAGSSDFAFLLLPSLPAGRFFLGWNANASALTNGTVLYRLSHPAPNSFPLPQSFTSYTNDPNFGCPGLGPNFLLEHPTAGTTSGGSSGSPIMLANGQVVGQQTGGCGPDLANDCDTAVNDDFDGAFSVTYPAIQQYLAPSSGCVRSTTTLCIDDKPGDRRFAISVSYHTSQGGGKSGAGNSLPLSSLGITQGGVFWFFSATNPEMLIKVINACSLNNNFWVFFSAGTNVGFTVTVKDTSTGHQKTYSSADLNAAPPVQDTSALTCP